MTTTRQAPTVLADICAMTGVSIHEGYSGRFMYGAKCWGVRCADLESVREVQAEAKRRGIGQGSQDQLGKGYIVYWPGLAMEEN